MNSVLLNIFIESASVLTLSHPGPGHLSMYNIIPRSFLITVYLFCFSGTDLIAQNEYHDGAPDVQSYHVYLEPDISGNYLEGNVIIRFSNAHANSVILDCGNLTINSVVGESVRSFHQDARELKIYLHEREQNEHLVQIFYEGSPARGVNFMPEQNQVYTNYFTSEWMVSNKHSSDRANIRIDLVVPDGLSSVAPGVLAEKRKIDGNRSVHSWIQEISTPPYTYGFAIGSFHYVHKNRNDIVFNYYSNSYSPDDLEIIFTYTTDMMKFFEEKSGVPYNQKSYSQILIGNHYQEMSGFAVLRESYGKLVLEDSTETNLISHELAHQWWGNMITCENWGQIWLNEALATYMSAAYNEHRFGSEKYMSNIQSYHEVYLQIKENGDDKPLVFEDWSNPSGSDRNIVYFKGAYVLHLLREEMGSQNFWEGIKNYSQKNYGKSVTTENFQDAMEKTVGRSLQAFFDRWIYLKV